MSRSASAWVKITGARVVSLLTGKIPDQGTWPMVWGNSRLYAADRWKKRRSAFEHRSYDYDDAMRFAFATRRGSARDIREGSMPREALEFIASRLPKPRLNHGLRGLHIGNFVGISLAHLCDAACRLDSGAVVLSIDPNVPHRGVDSPQDLVVGLMNRYGFEGNWIPVTAFSLEPSPIYDVKNASGSATAFASYHGQSASEGLGNLERLGCKFDFVLIDGNHTASYLRRELAVIAKIVRPGAMIFLDDVDKANWQEVHAVFNKARRFGFAQVAHQGRVGVLRRLRPAEMRQQPCQDPS
ncbi:class I SAM-dependent methyltransferase [Sedimentitalea sp. XS_ASV28]|uniref:class I SAM-dependent methyltransferase n=1 Tax=Sedimentitalea sp. XS_ASV28 TaxID=3241296 RepID=UPI003510EAFD